MHSGDNVYLGPAENFGSLEDAMQGLVKWINDALETAVESEEIIEAEKSARAELSSLS